jgi:hypothetical protein
MKLISSYELVQRSESELSALFRAVSEGLGAPAAVRPSAGTHSPRWETLGGCERSA